MTGCSIRVYNSYRLVPYCRYFLLHLILLRVPVLSLCGATEYYVRPTEPTNTSCPGQPCLTLSQYIKDSDHYFQSNTVFKFLPGTHNMDRPLIIGNVHNLSLESYNDEQPQLVAQFPCKTEVHACFYIFRVFPHQYHLEICCASIWLHDVNLLTVKTLTIIQQTPNATGLLMQRIVNITIALVETYSISETLTRAQHAIAVMDSYFIQICSLIARNWWSGLLFINSNHIHIYNVTTSDNYIMGMITQNSSSIYLSSSRFTNNTELGGIAMYEGYNIVINNITSMYNSYGITFLDIYTAQIVNVIASNNTYLGMNILRTKNITISNTTISHNVEYGLVISWTTIIFKEGFIDMISGIYVYHVINGTLSTYNKVGIVLIRIDAAQIVNTIASNNTDAGIILSETMNINISTITVSYINGSGLMIFSSIRIHIDGINATDNSLYGIYLSGTKWTYITRGSQQ